MKTIIILFSIIILSINIFPQTKAVEPGLYLVISRDSCNGQTNKNIMVFNSDTLCLGQKPVVTVGDIVYCKTDTANLDGHELYVLNISLNDSAKFELLEKTKHNVGKKMALVIGHEVVMAAVIRDPIANGRLTVSGAKAQEINLWAEELQKALKIKR